jgi:hypothetical protein
MIPRRAAGLHVCAVSLVGKARGARFSCPKGQLTSPATKEYRPHREPDAHLTMFAAMLVTATKHELLEEPPDDIHDCKRGCDADERKREFLGLEQLVDARQSLVNVDLAPVSSKSPT